MIEQPRPFHVFAHEDEGNMGDTSADRPRISIATDASLDEGAIIRTDSHDGGSPIGAPVQYFVGMDSNEVACALAALDHHLEVAESEEMDTDPNTPEWSPDDIRMIRDRVARLDAILNGGTNS